MLALKTSFNVTHWWIVLAKARSETLRLTFCATTTIISSEKLVLIGVWLFLFLLNAPNYFDVSHIISMLITVF